MAALEHPSGQPGATMDTTPSSPPVPPTVISRREGLVCMTATRWSGDTPWIRCSCEICSAPPPAPTRP